MVQYDGRLIGHHFEQGFATAANVSVHLVIFLDHPSCSDMRTFDSSRVNRNGIKALWLIEVSAVTVEVLLHFNTENPAILRSGSDR